jgi:hypothetical protein
MAISADAYLEPIYKSYYTDEKMEQLLWRNDPAVKRIKKMRITGENFKYAMLYGRGGAVSGNGATAVSYAQSVSKNVQATVPPGQLFSAFQISLKEILAGANMRGAFEDPAIVQMFAASEALRKTSASAFYATGFGEVGKNIGAITGGAGVFTFVTTASAIAGLDVGSYINFTDGSVGLPSDPLIAGGPWLIDSINGTTVTVHTALVNNISDGAWIEIDGGRTGSTGLLPVGLGAILPNFFDRTGAAWDAYIAQPLYGVTRNAMPDRLAGGFYKKGGSDTYANALAQGLKIARRQGGIPDMIVMNDDDFQVVLADVYTKANLYNVVGGVGTGGKIDYQAGLGNLGVQVQNSWISNVIDSPYCPAGTAYMLEEQVVKFIGLSNAETPMNDGVTDNNPGAPKIDQDGKPDMQYNLRIDDFMSIQNTSVGQDGAGALVLLSLYGTYIVTNPAHCCVVQFV